MKKKLVGFYDYTVILTYCGMLFAFWGILHVIGEKYWDALLCLMLAGICDMFDGAVAATKARTTEEKKFGIQIDSLSDLISFGVLPAVFVYILGEKTLAAALAAGLYVLCALIRLAYYNVTEEARQKMTTEPRETFIGVPVTTIAMLLPAVYLLYDYKLFQNKGLFLVLLLLMAMGFISPFEVRKPKVIGKIVLLVLGFCEALVMIFMVGWGAL